MEEVNPANGEGVTVPLGQAQLFLDDELIESKDNVTRVWHHLRKHPGNPLILRSGLEEGLYLFGSVLREPEPGSDREPVFRMWYYAVGHGARWVAYARSRDGLKWEKPELGLVEIADSRANNAVFMPKEYSLGGLSGIIRDPNPAVRADERYKVIHAGQNMSYVKGGPRPHKPYVMGVSPDGLHWKFHGIFTPAHKADRACFVWDPFRKLYALYARTQHRTPELVKAGGPAYVGRAVMLCTSRDFRKWTQGEMVMHAETDDPPGTEIYGMSAFPYEGQWVALPQIHRSIPYLAYIDIAIAHSRDGIKWRREKELVLARGGVGEWDRFNQCASTQPVQVGDELWIYYSGRLYRHGEYSGFPDYCPDTRREDSGPYHIGIGLATLRLDGWCSYQAGFDGGQIVTRPVTLPKGELFVNAKSDWGDITVEILDVQGKAIENMRSEPVCGDGVRLQVRWPQASSLAVIAGRPVRLRFTLGNAVLYSWKVE